VTPEGYCVVDENLPIHKENRYCGDENEEYGKPWEYRFGPVEGHAYGHRLCVLAPTGAEFPGSQSGYAEAESRTQPVRHAFARSARRERSPDAFAYLREYVIKSETGPLTVKNFERWLIQREVDGHRSVPCERVDRSPLPYYDLPDRHWDYDARRTDRQNGQSGLAFQLATKFWAKPGPALLKVGRMARRAWRCGGQEACGREGPELR
jgi:hypothetical protein